MMGVRGGWWRAPWLAFCLAAAPLAAQQPDTAAARQLQLQLLRSATAREAVGDLTGAEALLREALRRQPASVPAILSLERVLTKEGHRDALVPVLHNFLSHDPTSVLAWLMLLRTYSALDRVAALDSAAHVWLRAAPESPAPVRNIASVWRTRGEPQRALAVLETGRTRFGPDTFALELGEVYGDLGQYGRALDEWDRAIGEDARGFDAVRREVRALPDGGTAIIPALIDRLTRGPSNRARRAAAVELSMDAGLQDVARRWASAVLDDTPPADAKAYLVSIARGADARDLPHLASWAYERLLAYGDSLADAPALHARAAELALALGDTAVAERHYAAVEAAFGPGSPQRRRAGAVRIRLMADRGKADAAADALTTFRKEYPQAAEVDRLAAVVGEAYLRRGKTDDARRIIAGMRGPRCALLRGRLALEAGRADSARQAFTAAAAGLHGAEATAVLELTNLLAGLSTPAATRVAAALGAGALRPDTDLVRRLDEAAKTVPQADRAAVLDYAASVADELDPASAARFRRAIVDEYPTSPQAASALLGLARGLAAQPDSIGPARELLERLILKYPESALVPEARRRLGRLKGEVPPDTASGAIRP